MRRLLFAVPFFILGTLWGQGERGSLDGTVTDASGAAVPNATVVAVQTETNVETKATSTA